MQRRRRMMVVSTLLIGLIGWIVAHEYPSIQDFFEAEKAPESSQNTPDTPGDSAISVLETLDVKGRAPKTDYRRSQFGDGWLKTGGCDMRNIILRRDLTKLTFEEDECKVKSGTLNDPYTGKIIEFQRGTTSSAVQIDHVVALSDAWQKGAQNLTKERRQQFANDPLNLLAVDGPANQAKGDGDAATWLPPFKPFRCQYAARQVAVKKKYNLWVTEAEKSSLKRTLESCPEQKISPEMLKLGRNNLFTVVIA